MPEARSVSSIICRALDASSGAGDQQVVDVDQRAHASLLLLTRHSSKFSFFQRRREPDATKKTFDAWGGWIRERMQAFSFVE
jgi:hypothetical protein